MCCVLQGDKWGCDFNELIYGPRSHWPDDLQLLLSLNSDDLICHYAPDPLCQCGAPARQGVVPSELGYGYFCGNIVGEEVAWVSSYKWSCNYSFVICGFYRHWLWWFLLNLSIGSIQEGATGKHSRVVRNFLIKFEEKEISLGRGWCMKESNSCVRNIWGCHRVEFLGQLRESWICLSTMELWTTCMMSTIMLRHTGDKILGNILLSGFGTNIVLICYVSLSSQDMSSELGVRQGRSNWRIPCILRATTSSDEGWGGEDVSTGGWTTEEVWGTRHLRTLLCQTGRGEQTC
jgi:hypothetical protein